MPWRLRISRIVLMSALSIGAVDKCHAEDVKIRICKSSDKINGAWGYNFPYHLEAISRRSVDYKGLDIKFAFDDSTECAELSQRSCFSSSKTVYCNEDSIARILHGIAWVSLGWASLALSEAKAMKEKHQPVVLIKELPFSFDKGLELADARWKTPDDGGSLAVSITENSKLDFGQFIVDVMAVVPDFSKFIVDVAKGPEAQQIWRTHEAASNMIFAYAVYEIAVNDVLAFLVGHEMAHGSDKCAIDIPSKAETSGMLSKFLKLQSSGDLFCPNDLVLSEVLADRCALRLTERIDSAMATEKKRDLRYPREIVEPSFSVGRRIAIDTIAWLSYSGLGNRSKDTIKWVSNNEGKYSSERRTLIRQSSKGYINDPLRVILFSSLLNEFEENDKNFVSICDFSAKATVEMLRRDQMQCQSSVLLKAPKQAKLAESLGSYLPFGVSEGWKSGRWSEISSFMCRK